MNGTNVMTLCWPWENKVGQLSQVILLYRCHKELQTKLHLYFATAAARCDGSVPIFQCDPIESNTHPQPVTSLTEGSASVVSGWLV